MSHKKYVFKPYDPNFPRLFLEESKRIQNASAGVLTIEHVGSTAVEGLSGKGIIDILIVVPKLKIENTLKLLQSLSYEFRKDYSEEDRLFFRTDLPDAHEGSRTYHVHLTFSKSNTHYALVRFRDYLKKHPDARLKYARMKQAAAQQAQGKGEVYRKAKAHFFATLPEKLFKQ